MLGFGPPQKVSRVGVLQSFLRTASRKQVLELGKMSFKHSCCLDGWILLWAMPADTSASQGKCARVLAFRW